MMTGCELTFVTVILSTCVSPTGRTPKSSRSGVRRMSSCSCADAPGASSSTAKRVASTRRATRATLRPRTPRGANRVQISAALGQLLLERPLDLLGHRELEDRQQRLAGHRLEAVE